MSDYKPITGELRKYATVSWDPWPDARDRLYQMCDRIDAEHESACAEAYGNGVMSVPVALDENAWVELPKDADGVPIHVGDTVTCGRNVWEVTGLRLIGAAWGVCCTIFNDHGGSGTNVYPPCDLRHYHAPTVEDVLREFARECLTYATCVDDHEVQDAIEMYAAKLRAQRQAAGAAGLHDADCVVRGERARA